MTFEELLANLLGARSRWLIEFKVSGEEGRIGVKGGKIIFAEIERGGNHLEGKDALKEILSLSKEIENVELSSLEEERENLNVDQFELFSMISGEEEEGSEQEVVLFEEEKRTPFWDLCCEIFSNGSVKLLLVGGRVEYGEGVKEEDLRFIFSKMREVKEAVNPKYAVLNFEKLTGLVFFGKEMDVLVVVDDRGKGDFELDEPEIVRKFLSLLE